MHGVAPLCSNGRVRFVVRLTCADPAMSSTFTVNRATLRVLKEELDRCSQQLQLHLDVELGKLVHKALEQLLFITAPAATAP